jgi:hypothetical protein
MEVYVPSNDITRVVRDELKAHSSSGRKLPNVL